MRRLFVVPRTARISVGILSAGLLLTACTSKERAPDSARAVDSSAAAAPATPNTLATNAPGLPGALTKPIEQYTGDELYDFVQRLQWGGGADRERNCKDDPACAGTKRTQVRVDAVNGQDSLSALNVPANGVIGVRALNKGTAVEARYGFKPEKKLEYYLIVLPGTRNAGRWQLEELDTTPGARRHTRVGSGTFTPCNHPFRPGRVNRANFYTCADSHLSDSTQRSGLVPFAPPNTDPLWMDCAQGCCLADG